MSGLLNASFGNAVEIIVGIAALLNGLSIAMKLSASTDDVPRSITNCSDVCECLRTIFTCDRLTLSQMLGSILSNILLVLGCSFLAGKGPLLLKEKMGSLGIGGLYHTQGFFNGTGAQACVLCCSALLNPSLNCSAFF
jgi:Ca2+:H+ antiporter